jgi:triacylglycerol lipase
MNPPEFVDVGAGALPAPTSPFLEPQLHLEDALASAGRLWVRGRLRDPAAAPVAGGGWLSWWGKAAPAALPVAALEAEVGGRTLRADVPLAADGAFEALFTLDLPPARRGWRIARCAVTCAGRTARACGVALAPPAGTRAVLVVQLPLAFTRARENTTSLAQSDEAQALAELLRHLRQERDHAPVYYLAAVSPREENRQAELALTATALGWPEGHFILVPADNGALPGAVEHALNRLRWLFAGDADLHLLNLEPSLTAAVARVAGETPDRAPVYPVSGPGTALPLAAAGRSPAWPGRVPRGPVVFCHGMLALSTLRRQLPTHFNYFLPLRDFLQERGARVLFPQVGATSGVVARAGQLRDQIVAATSEPVNLIAHSMGGLDARHLITHLGMAGQVRSLTTVATPHHGSYVADWFCAHFRREVPLLPALEALGLNVDGVHDCQRAACKRFNAHTPDAPGVRYFSFGAAVPVRRVSPALRRAWHLVTPVEGPNDGVVSEASARWGEYLGTLAVDHFGVCPDGRFCRPGESFDALGFYGRLVEELAWRGF